MSDYKYNRLLEILQKYEKIGVACSGGVDSTLLLYGAMEALGPDNVAAFYIHTRLQSRDSIECSRKVFSGNFAVSIAPLSLRVVGERRFVCFVYFGRPR